MHAHIHAHVSQAWMCASRGEKASLKVEPTWILEKDMKMSILRHTISLGTLKKNTLLQCDFRLQLWVYMIQKMASNDSTNLFFWQMVTKLDV